MHRDAMLIGTFVQPGRTTLYIESHIDNAVAAEWFIEKYKDNPHQAFWKVLFDATFEGPGVALAIAKKPQLGSRSASRGSCSALNVLINWGANMLLMTQNRHTPLLEAIHQGPADVVRLLLQWGFDSGEMDKERALRLAMRTSRRANILSLLSDCGAELVTMKMQ